MKFTVAPAPHYLGAESVPRIMQKVLLALAPALVVHIWFFGVGIVLNIFVAALFAVASEAAVLRLRQRPVVFFLTDYSALVTAVLLAFALPPLMPWWITAIGSICAIVLAKHLYGGLGYNIFNPAMVGYVVLLVSFPEELSRWPTPLTDDIDRQSVGVLGTLTYFLSGHLPDGLQWDAISRATPLDTVQTELGRMRTMNEITASPIFGSMGGFGWEWINLATGCGGLWLLKRGIIQWQIPASMLGTLFIVSMLFYIGDSGINASPFLHLMSGSAIIGAFFIATDPVSAAATPRGRLIYGACIGLLTFIIRRWGSYPDGVAFAVLLMNLSVPLIDRFTSPRIYGKH